MQILFIVGVFICVYNSSLFTAYRGWYVFAYFFIVHTSESDRPITKVYKRRRAAISPMILIDEGLVVYVKKGGHQH